MRLKIYLADLTHTGVGIATEAFPLNIGLIASYAKKRFGMEVDVCLFKYPEELSEAIRIETPHILGCSNYAWNSNLGYHFLSMAKSLHPEVITVFGGTNYPFDSKNQKKFLQQRPALDLHIFYEGEIAFASLVEKRLSVSSSREVFDGPISGCQFLNKETEDLISGPPVERLKELDLIPSPYVTGILDKFFDGKLSPLLETARGCPFTCNFCNAGDRYFNKVNLFSDAYVRGEFEYVAKKASRVGAYHMTLCDNNFGMIPRDAGTAELVAQIKQKHGWPRTVTAWTGKNSKQRVIDATKLLGETLQISMSVQSMDPAVLVNIKRSNIRLEDYQAITHALNQQGRPQVAEIIVPLPGETFETHRKAVRDLLDTEVASVITHTLQLLHGTPYKDDEEYVRRYGYQAKYRIVPLDFGIYDGNPTFDTEAVSVVSRDFSLEDYLNSRRLLLLIDLCYNSNLFAALKKYIRSHNKKYSEWIDFLFDRLSQFPAEVSEIFKSFETETLSELWNSEEELMEHYSNPENYERLVRGDAGGNVLFRHKVLMMWQASDKWVNAIFSISQIFLEKGESDNISQIRQEMEALKKFILISMADSFEFRLERQWLCESFSVDILAWLRSESGKKMTEFYSADPIKFKFYFDERQMAIKQDASARYGATLSGLVKLIQRVGNHRFSRFVDYDEEIVPVGSNDGRQ